MIHTNYLNIKRKLNEDLLKHDPPTTTMKRLYKTNVSIFNALVEITYLKRLRGFHLQNKYSL